MKNCGATVCQRHVWQLRDTRANVRNVSCPYFDFGEQGHTQTSAHVSGLVALQLPAVKGVPDSAQVTSTGRGAGPSGTHATCSITTVGGWRMSSTASVSSFSYLLQMTKGEICQPCCATAQD
jgi:hypothetical protein